jgi:pimeloyl-ACP methyl ester carboxylesterase
MANKKLLCLHGFLGCPKQFDFLRSEFDVHSPDLRDYVSLSYDEIVEKLYQEHPGFNKMNVLGYSFGSRLGARLFVTEKVEGKFIGLAGHAGMKTDEERARRLVFEESMVQKLNELSNSEFLLEWNSYDIFSHDEPLDINLVDFNNADLFFKNYGLSKQPYLYPELLKRKEAVFYYYGAKDDKYVNYATEELKKLNVIILNEKGHRLISSHSEILNICRTQI